MSHKSEQWQALDEKYKLLSRIEKDSYATITAREISEVQKDYPNLKFEPRLLTHFDNEMQLPDLFIDNNLSILPIERGSYIIGKFNIFQKAPTNYSSIEVRSLPRLVELESLQEEMLTNEAMGLNFALANGILDDYIGEGLTATVAGRQSGGTWNYHIESGGSYLKLTAKNPQIEVDGGYESHNFVLLIEAKNSLVSQFNLRQLYFPYRTWREKVKKTVRTVFATFDNGEVYLHEYIFPQYDLFKGEKGRSIRYQISDDLLPRSRVESLLRNTLTGPNKTGVSFPQADNIFIVISLIDYLAKNGTATRDEIAEHYGFHIRQSGYYGEAVVYLGFAEKIQHGFETNINGQLFSRLDTRTRYQRIIVSFCQTIVFRETLKESLCRNAVPERCEITKIILKYVPNINHVTANRRASTVRSWMKWAVSVMYPSFN